MQVMLVLHAAMHLHQHVQEHRNSTPSIGRHFRNKHSLASRDLTKNFSVLKKSSNKLDCLLYEMFFYSRTETCSQFAVGLNSCKGFQLWITVKWPRSYLISHLFPCTYNVVRTSKILCSKMKFKTLREKIQESVQRTLRFCFIHEHFLKSLGCISSKKWFLL